MSIATPFLLKTPGQQREAAPDRRRTPTSITWTHYRRDPDGVGL